ncbi:MAG: sugar phosphate nucleotidyltransferase [Lachnospiraceae bacterium]
MMKVVILAGGLPSTITEDKVNIPKPMVDIGENPILWHIMKNFAACGIKDFIICAGYKGNMIKDYFNDYYIYQSDITVDLANNTIQIHKNISEDWKVTIVDTGLYAAIGTRISRIQDYIEDETFLVTYGDCLSDIDFSEVIKYHDAQNKLATLVAARPSGRNTALPLDAAGNYCGHAFMTENEQHAWTNSGTYLFNRQIFKYLCGNYELESQLLETLAEKQQIATYKHTGFWSPIETKRDKERMLNLWNAGIAPWKTW